MERTENFGSSKGVSGVKQCSSLAPLPVRLNLPRTRYRRVIASGGVNRLASLCPFRRGESGSVLFMECVLSECVI